MAGTVALFGFEGVAAWPGGGRQLPLPEDPDFREVNTAHPKMEGAVNTPETTRKTLHRAQVGLG